jgi:hypothetical protein
VQYSIVFCSSFASLIAANFGFAVTLRVALLRVEAMRAFVHAQKRAKAMARYHATEDRQITIRPKAIITSKQDYTHIVVQAVFPNLKCFACEDGQLTARSSFWKNGSIYCDLFN